MLIVVAAAVLLPGISLQAAADEVPSALYLPASFAVDGRSALLPARWRIDTYLEADSLETLLAFRKSSARSTGFLNLSALSYGFGDGFDDHSSFAYRIAEIDRSRLVTFWESESVGVFLGIRKGGYVSLRIAY